MENTNSVGIVPTHYFTFAAPPNEMQLECGKKLGPITLAYETYGELNEDKSNAVLICHALSGDAHVAGLKSPEDKKPGWWDTMVGPGKAFDTNKYFVICSNVIGGCKGSTGPNSKNPATGQYYGLDFPIVTIGDMVNAQKALIDHLGITQLYTVVGGSMGGFQVLQWAIAYPDMLRSVMPIATTSRLSAQSIAFNVVGRRAIMSDPNFMNGKYYDKAVPLEGLAIARMIGHITYLSEESMHAKFGRRLQDKDAFTFDFSTEFQVESYLKYKGDAFVERFDANAYLYITKAMDYFDLTKEKGTLVEAFKGVQSRFLVAAFSSDWLFPPRQSKEIVKALKLNYIPTTYYEIQSDYGHDAFLLETEELTQIIQAFLTSLTKVP